MLPRKCIQKNEEGNTDLLLTLLCFFLLSCETASKSPFTSAAHKCKCFTAAVATLQCLKVTKNVSLSEESRFARNVKYVKGHFFERFLKAATHSIITQKMAFVFTLRFFFCFSHEELVRGHERLDDVDIIQTWWWPTRMVFVNWNTSIPDQKRTSGVLWPACPIFVA